MPETTATNAIMEELNAFARSIKENTTPPVSLQDGVNALQLAHKILAEIDRRLENRK
jgi:predicted dehydrogenase